MIFRSPVAAVLPLLTVGLVFGVATALMALLGTALHVEVGQELPTMLVVVLFGIGTDYVLFLLFRYRERVRAGDSPRDAIVAAVERVGGAIVSAATAVIAAFGALVLAALGFFTTLGPALAVAVAVMVAAALTLVPAVVTVLGRHVFWPAPDPRCGAATGRAPPSGLAPRRPEGGGARSWGGWWPGGPGSSSRWGSPCSAALRSAWSGSLRTTTRSPRSRPAPGPGGLRRSQAPLPRRHARADEGLPSRGSTADPGRGRRVRRGGGRG